MEWLFKPRVQVGLLVNLAFVIFTLVSSHVGAPTPVRWHPTFIDDSSAASYAPLPPPSAPSRAVTSESGGRLNVSLDNGLTLVRRPGYTLIFSPYMDAPNPPAEPPPLVTMRFITFSEDEDEDCPGACMLVINADGKRVLESATTGTFSSGWKRDKISPVSATVRGQEVTTRPAETLTAQIPYDMFLEIISAKRVVMSLGPDKVELTHDQINALRDMHRRVIPQAAEEQRESKIIKKL